MAVTQFGAYEVVDELGRGGMGVVYRAKDADLGREVAVKVLSDALANEDAVVERFKREARSMAALNHPNIIQVHFIGEDDGKPYIVMEYVPGESLKDRVKRDAPLELKRALNFIAQTASGLAAAHASNVVHRDVKPANLIITPDNQVKIADFGIAFAKELGEKLTTTGQFVGTPGYLSPEVCLGESVDQRSDIFSLGVVLYEMLTGKIPFGDVSPLGMMLEVVQSEVPDVREINDKVDEETSRILQRMIAKDPNQRYQSCSELLDDLEKHPDYSASGVWRTGPGATMLPPTASPQKATSLVSVDAVRDTLQRADAEPTQPPPAKSSKAGLAVAAILLITAGAGGVWAYRSDWFDKKISDVGRASALASRAADEPEASDDETTRDDESGLSDAKLAELERLRLVAAERRAKEAEQAEQSVDNAEIAGSKPASDARPNGRNEQLVALESPRKVPPIERREAERVPTSSERVVQLDGTSSSKVAVVTPTNVPQVEARVAIANTQPKAASRPSLHGVLVVAIGDPAVARPVESLLQKHLADEAIPVLDTEMMSDLGQYVGVDGVDLPGLTDFARDQGAAAVLLARVDHLGEQYISAYGTGAQLNTALLSVKAYDVVRKRSVGTALEEQINYTGMTAREQAAEAVNPMLAELSERLDEYR